MSIDKYGLWLLLAAVATALYLMTRRASKGREPAGTAPALTTAQQRQIEQEIQRLLDELSQMTRDVGQQLDKRAARLEQLIKEAQKTIEAMESASGRRAGPAKGAAPPGTDAPRPKEADSLFEPRHADVYTLADKGRTPAEIARELGRPHGEIELILALRPRK